MADDETATLGPAAPTPPIPLGGSSPARPRLGARRVEVPEHVLQRLSGICEVVVEPAELGEASRDWWPQAMIWALDGEVAGLASAVCRPTSADHVAEVLAVCNEAHVPVTAAAGRSGVCGASVP